MKKILVSLFISLVFLGSAAYLLPASATTTAKDEINAQLQAAAGEKGAGLGAAQDPRLIAANIIRSVLQVLGILFLILTVYAGFLWMTAGGNEDQVKKAKSLLFQAVIGLVIILAAYAITQFVISIAQGKWTDYQNQYYIEQPTPIPCGVEKYGTQCP